MSTVETTLKIALAGNPNCGKTALFNALTGSRQKVGNYPGVTVERKEGTIVTPSGLTFSLFDLPGTYSLDARTPDEQVTRDVLFGLIEKESEPKLLVAVADATNLERNLGLVLELRALGKPVVLALNMMDLARERGIELDLGLLAKELKVPVVPTVAVRRQGIAELLKEIEARVAVRGVESAEPVPPTGPWRKPTSDEVRARFREVDRILRASVKNIGKPTVWTDRIDRLVLHPVWGSIVLAVVLATLFQAVFTWASAPADLIEAGIAALGVKVGQLLSEGALRSLLVDGVIAGVGSVLVFLPQILLLFFFILLLEDFGYMARAAFLMDRMMGKAGLHGRAFIPLLSGHACAIPGIMAARTIENPRDRLTTILVTPLTTCSARLPVYSLLIAAFIPNTEIWGPLRLQGIVMFSLYLGGVLAALGVASVIRLFVFRGPKPPLLLELPSYKWPSTRNVVFGMLERARLFLRRAGTVILALSVLLWFLSSYPKAPPVAPGSEAAWPAIHYSYAGRLGRAIEPLVAPIGFNWRIGIALIPGFAAREVMVGALGTVYAVEASDVAGQEGMAQALGQLLRKDWSIATALSLLMWYVFAPQCLSTLAVVRRETNSWRWPLVMLVYMTALAYLGSFVVYRLALLAGLG